MAGTDFYEDDEDPRHIRDEWERAEARGDTGVTTPPWQRWTVAVDRNVSHIAFTGNLIGYWGQR